MRKQITKFIKKRKENLTSYPITAAFIGHFVLRTSFHLLKYKLQTSEILSFVYNAQYFLQVFFVTNLLLHLDSNQQHQQDQFIDE